MYIPGKFSVKTPGKLQRASSASTNIIYYQNTPTEMADRKIIALHKHNCFFFSPLSNVFSSFSSWRVRRETNVKLFYSSQNTTVRPRSLMLSRKWDGFSCAACALLLIPGSFVLFCFFFFPQTAAQFCGAEAMLTWKKSGVANGASLRSQTLCGFSSAAACCKSKYEKRKKRKKCCKLWVEGTEGEKKKVTTPSINAVKACRWRGLLKKPGTRRLNKLFSLGGVSFHSFDRACDGEEGKQVGQVVGRKKKKRTAHWKRSVCIVKKKKKQTKNCRQQQQKKIAQDLAQSKRIQQTLRWNIKISRNKVSEWL